MELDQLLDQVVKKKVNVLSIFQVCFARLYPFLNLFDLFLFLIKIFHYLITFLFQVLPSRVYFGLLFKNTQVAHIILLFWAKIFKLHIIVQWACQLDLSWGKPLLRLRSYH